MVEGNGCRHVKHCQTMFINTPSVISPCETSWWVSLPHRSVQNQNNKNSKAPQGSARLRTLYRCAGLVLQDPGAVRVVRVEARKSHSNQCMRTATCIPNAITLREPTAQTTILINFIQYQMTRTLCTRLWLPNKPQPHWKQLKKDSQISNFCWHVSFGGGSQDEYRARSKPRSCKVMNDTPRQYRKRRSLTVTFFPLRNLFLRVIRPAGCHKVTISHRQDPNRTYVISCHIPFMILLAMTWNFNFLSTTYTVRALQTYKNSRSLIALRLWLSFFVSGSMMK